MQHVRDASQAERELGVEREDFATRTSSSEDLGRLVVATYNIRYAAGSHLIGGSLLRRAGLGRLTRRPALVRDNIEKAARVLSESGAMPRADVVGIQEADRGTVRAGSCHVARELAEALRMNYVRAHVPTPADVAPKDRKWWLDFEERIGVGEAGDTGVAILSRLPLADAARIELPWKECPWRPRLAVAASVPFGGRRLHVFNAHIDTHANIAGQLEQHSAVLDIAGRLCGTEPVVLLGDFNTLDDEARHAARALLESHGYTTPLPTGTATWRSGPLRYHYDWIFTRYLSVTRWGVARVRGISDHWPVWVEVEPERIEGLEPVRSEG
ncbi:MAG TPA: endonuclease/exonuclease/phosphatase family protein [Pyrinomonadaceae bacterium]|nr:endonuclease/exonuclease/phosphatase family protein [Pyrinomonadaceae bacterium]